MGELLLSPRMKIKTLKAKFKEEFGSTLRVYKGAKFADDEDTLASIASKKIEKNSEFNAHGNMKVSTFEEKMNEVFGIKVQVALSDDSGLAPNNVTLSESGKLGGKNG